MTVLCLPHGKYTLIDDEDLDFVRKWHWGTVIAKGRAWYVRRSLPMEADGKTRKEYLHRALTGAGPLECVDHRNRDTLDNRRGNLRVCTYAQNNSNTRIRITSKSGFKGVSWNTSDKRWKASVGQAFVGNFMTAIEAALAYDAAAIEAFGEFACTNKSLGLLKST